MCGETCIPRDACVGNIIPGETSIPMTPVKWNYRVLSCHMVKMKWLVQELALGILGNWVITSWSYVKPQSRESVNTEAFCTLAVKVSSYHLAHSIWPQWMLIVCFVMQDSFDYSYSFMWPDLFVCPVWK